MRTSAAVTAHAASHKGDVSNKLTRSKVRLLTVYVIIHACLSSRSHSPYHLNHALQLVLSQI